MTGLFELAATARASGDRLLHARLALERAMAGGADTILVTPAPLDPKGPDGPLFGVPVTVKDCYETAGLRSTAGHLPLSDHVPAADAVLVARLRATGAVVLGKTNLAELCGDVQTDNPVFGRTDNPWDRARTTGGSGGGGAAAVALGLSRLDLGSDLAGSVRVPAGFCGVAALKAGRGRLPMTGHIPPLPGSSAAPSPFAAVGLTARDSADLSAGWQALTGEHTEPIGDGTLSLACAMDLGLPLCPRSTATLTLMSGWLRKADHRLTGVRLDHRAAWRAYGTLLTAPAAVDVRPWQGLLLRLLARLTPGRPIRGAMLRGLAGEPPAPAQAAQATIISAVDDILSRHDALICPVAAIAAFPHAPKPQSWFVSRRIGSGSRRLPYMEASIGMTCIFSLTGHPVAVVPGALSDGLPVGLQIIARHGAEARLLAIAARIEAVFAKHRPPLWQTLAERHQRHHMQQENPNDQ